METDLQLIGDGFDTGVSVIVAKPCSARLTTGLFIFLQREGIFFDAIIYRRWALGKLNGWRFSYSCIFHGQICFKFKEGTESLKQVEFCEYICLLRYCHNVFFCYSYGGDKLGSENFWLANTLFLGFG